MGAPIAKQSIGAALFNKTQRALLALFFVHPEQSFYLRQVTRLAGIGQGAAQRELMRWVGAGLLLRTRQGHQVYYRANTKSPVFAELKSLTTKTVGVADVLQGALAGMADRIAVAFVHGSVASGMEKTDSDVDVMVVGKVSFREVVTALTDTQNALGREVNPTVYSEREFRQKLRPGHHFVKTVAGGPKIFLKGDEGDLWRR
jgi:predicted nucleotidyltransferase